MVAAALRGAAAKARIGGVAAPRRYHHIACVAAPCICPPGARAKMPTYSARTLKKQRAAFQALWMDFRQLAKIHHFFALSFPVFSIAYDWNRDCAVYESRLNAKTDTVQRVGKGKVSLRCDRELWSGRRAEVEHAQISELQDP